MSLPGPLGGVPDEAAAGGVVPDEDHQDSRQLGPEGIAGHKAVEGRSQAHIGQHRQRRHQQKLQQALQQGHDHTLEVDDAELASAKGLRCTADRAELSAANVFIVTVPTPIDEYKRPDLTPLIKASETIGAVLKKGDIVIYESTVYPGATEEDCVPVLERVSGLVFNKDFFAGYSPERINPGDKEHRVSTIKKVTSGSTPEIAALVDQLYREIIVAGTHCAPSIRVAEAAKVRRPR